MGKSSLKTVAFLRGIIYNIKAVCRDGGAVERARFEIVLCRNVYEGSNPSLCAKNRVFLLGYSIFVLLPFLRGI